MSSTTNESELLKMLANVIAQSPRSTLKELADAIGVSKATLHRLCGTRDNLENMLMEKSIEAFNLIVHTATNHHKDYRKAIRQLIKVHYEGNEFLFYVFVMKPSFDEENFNNYMSSIDTFFLNGQKAGAFKIDFSVQFLSSVFSGGIFGLIDSQKRGRLPYLGITESFEEFFLNGAQK